MRSLLDLTANHLWNELRCKLCEGAAGGFALDDLNHLSSDGPDLRRGGISCLLDLVWSAFGECNGKQTEEVVIGGLDCDIGFDQGLPLSDERPKLVGCEIETVEIGETVLSLNLIHTELDLAERMVLILLEIRQRNLKDPALQCIIRIL